MRRLPSSIPLWLCAALTALSIGCIDGSGDGPIVTGVSPEPVAAGGAIVIRGVGFAGRGHVAIGGRPIPELSREAERIDAILPGDVPGGAALLVVVADGRPSAPFPIDVIGPEHPDRPPRVFPPGAFPDVSDRDGGPPRRDRGIDPDDGIRPPRDAGPMGPLFASFDPDPAGARSVRLDVVEAPANRLVLSVSPPAGVFGLAMHLEYDRGLLRFLGAEPRTSRAFAASEIGPGRMAIGRVLSAADDQLIRLTFELVGPGEGRIDVPARRRTARDGENRPLPVIDFAGGGLRVERR